MSRSAIWIGAALTAAMLTVNGCGDGGGSGTSPAPRSEMSTGTVSAFITDNLAEDYEAVWVTLHEVTLAPGTDQEQTLFKSEEGEVFNLTNLSGVGELLAVENLETGTYSDFELRLANEVSLVSSEEDTIDAIFSTEQGGHTLEVVGELEVQEDEATSFALDFDLERFTYDSATNLVTPVVETQNEEEVELLQRTFARMDAEVTEVVDDATFRIQAEGEAESPVVTANIHDSGTVFEPGQGAPARDTSILEVGDSVNVNGNYDPESRTVTAVSVKIEGHEDEDTASGDEAYADSEAEGTLQSHDPANGTAELAVSDASFVPGGDTIEVVNLGNAEYARGSADLLAEDMEVEVAGSWDGNVLSARLVEIEGAETDSETGGDEALTEAKGRVTDRQGMSTLTVNVLDQEEESEEVGTEEEGSDLGSTLTLDIRGAWLKNGNPPCLQPGVIVELKGDLAGGSASVIELGDDAFDSHPGCQVAETEDEVAEEGDGEAAEEEEEADTEEEVDSEDEQETGDQVATGPGSDDAAPQASETTSSLVEAEARITSLQGNTLAVEIPDQEEGSDLGSSLTLDIAGALPPENGNRPCLQPGVTVELEGDLAGGSASVIEIGDDASGSHPGCQVAESEDEAAEEGDDEAAEEGTES